MPLFFSLQTWSSRIHPDAANAIPRKHPKNNIYSGTRGVARDFDPVSDGNHQCLFDVRPPPCLGRLQTVGNIDFGFVRKLFAHQKHSSRPLRIPRKHSKNQLPPNYRARRSQDLSLNPSIKDLAYPKYHSLAHLWQRRPNTPLRVFLLIHTAPHPNFRDPHNAPTARGLVSLPPLATITERSGRYELHSGHSRYINRPVVDFRPRAPLSAHIPPFHIGLCPFPDSCVVPSLDES